MSAPCGSRLLLLLLSGGNECGWEVFRPWPLQKGGSWHIMVGSSFGGSEKIKRRCYIGLVVHFPDDQVKKSSLHLRQSLNSLLDVDLRIADISGIEITWPIFFLHPLFQKTKKQTNKTKQKKRSQSFTSKNSTPSVLLCISGEDRQ